MPTQHVPCFGLVLCGGQSSRMGTDKAFITYHQEPQYIHVHDMLASHCEAVYISCNASQLHHIKDAYKTIVDHPIYKDAGPMTGLLSAFHQHPEASWLVIGCDYPFLTSDDLQSLAQNRDAGFDAVCFKNLATEMDEPLIAWYGKQLYPALSTAFHHQQTSLRFLLGQVNTLRLIPNDLLTLRSVDLPAR